MYNTLRSHAATLQWYVTIRLDLHFVLLSEHLADLEEGLVLGLLHNHPYVDERCQADHREEDEAVGAQAFLKKEEGRRLFIALKEESETLISCDAGRTISYRSKWWQPDRKSNRVA